MNKQIIKRYENRCCSWCNAKVYPSTFRDDVSFREYKISGMCQSCIDKTFGIDSESDI